MMKAIDLFNALGDRFRNFGNDAESQRVIDEACRANE